MKNVLVLVGIAFVVGCTPNDNNQSALDKSVVAPDQVPAAARPASGNGLVEQAARDRRCDELQGQAMRDCLERAQYVPENAQGLPGEPGTRRQDPDQVAPDPAERPPHVDDLEALQERAREQGAGHRPTVVPKPEENSDERSGR